MPKVAGDATGDGGVQAVVLVLNILNHLAEQRSAVGVTDLATALGTTKSRVYRHLRTLVQHGYVVQAEASERYQIGAALVRLGRLVGERFDLAGIASPVLRKLRDELGHTAVMGQVESTGVRIVTCIAVRSGITVEAKPGTLLSFHSTSQGKVALAFGGEDLRARILRSRLPIETPSTITVAAELDQELQLIRQRGWAVAPNEALVGVNVLAAPVFGASGVLVSTIGLIDSIQFIPATPSEQQIRLIKEAAKTISEALGYQQPKGSDPSQVG